MERGTGFEPATTSLEGWCSATELPPRVLVKVTELSIHTSLPITILATRRRGLPSAARRGPPSRFLPDWRCGGHPSLCLRSARRAKDGGQGGIRTPEGVSQQIYSLPPLAAWVPARFQGARPWAIAATSPDDCRTPDVCCWSWRSDLHRQPPVYKTGALLLSYASLPRRARDSRGGPGDRQEETAQAASSTEK